MTPVRSFFNHNTTAVKSKPFGSSPCWYTSLPSHFSATDRIAFNETMEDENQEGNANGFHENDGTAGNSACESNSHCPTVGEDGETIPTRDKSAREKRQQMTLSTSPIGGFFFHGLPASPPKFVSLDQIMKAANGVSDMFLAHEIAVNADFMLDKVEPEDVIHKQVKEVVHKAFWDVLRTELNESPPNYTQAMVLLGEVKEGIMSILLPYHTRIQIQINEILDMDLIQQQAENDVLDFKYYAHYIISTMSQLCAPIRDEKMKELKLLDDIIEIYKGILETLDLMKLDMANFTIQQFRPHIQQHSVEYERKKFQEFLEAQAALALPVDGLEFTRQWLKQAYEKSLMHSETPETSSVEQEPSYNVVLSKAYLHLLEWEDDTVFPETLLLDQARFLAQRDELILITLTASILLVTYSTVGEQIQGISEFKVSLKDHVRILLEDFLKCSENGLKMMIESAGMQVLKEVNDCLRNHGYNCLTQEKEKLLLGQIKDVESQEHSIRSLVRNRILAFMESALLSQASGPSGPMKIPPGLSSFHKELSHLTGQFLRLVGHNRSVFGKYYSEIISDVKQQRECRKLESKGANASTDAGVSV